MNANTEHDHAMPSVATMLSTAKGMTAPAILRAAAHAAKADDAKIPYASATSMIFHYVSSSKNAGLGLAGVFIGDSQLIMAMKIIW